MDNRSEVLHIQQVTAWLPGGEGLRGQQHHPSSLAVKDQIAAA